mgnify:CR=1 FL=1|jgi:hypothetical protein
MKLIRISYDTTTILMFAASEEDALVQLEAVDDSYVKLDPNGKWVFKWAEDAIMWSDIHTEVLPMTPGVVFRVSH